MKNVIIMEVITRVKSLILLIFPMTIVMNGLIGQLNWILLEVNKVSEAKNVEDRISKLENSKVIM